MRRGGADERVAALVYAGTMAGMGISFSALWLHATRHRRLVAAWLSDEQIRARTGRFVVGAPLYLIAMAGIDGEHADDRHSHHRGDHGRGPHRRRRGAHPSESEGKSLSSAPG
jgi:hypothetical protein